MEELIDILDENGNKTGQILPKKEAHEKLLRHAAAHIWIYNSKGEVLLQKRAITKSSHPGKRDISAAGHISAGEDMITGALRELEEELGLHINSSDLKEIAKWKKLGEDGEKNREHNILYLYKYDGDIKSLTMQVEEVDELRFIPIQQFKSDIQNSEIIKQYVQHKPEYFKIVIDAIENALKTV